MDIAEAQSEIDEEDEGPKHPLEGRSTALSSDNGAVHFDHVVFP